MENVLKFITKQAYLDRVLFSPGMKKIYFDMAVASGGVMQFKHTDSVRHGLSFVADKADDKKRALLFCSIYELYEGYDLMINMAREMLPAVVLATREGTPEDIGQNWTSTQLGNIGWIQFYTHTLQELYDHLALAYLMYEQHKVRLPVLILQSCLVSGEQYKYTPREDLYLGNPLMGLQTSRVDRKKDFSDAFASLGKKKEVQTLRGNFEDIILTIKEMYGILEYPAAENGLPHSIQKTDSDFAIVSLFPTEENADLKNLTFVRPYCYRPSSLASIKEILANKSKIAVVEPLPSPGVVIPPLYSEISLALNSEFAGKTIPVCLPPGTGTLKQPAIDEIKGIFESSSEKTEEAETIHKITM